MKINKDALPEYERMKQNDLFSTIKRNTLSDDTLIILVHNVRSLSKHIDDIESDDRTINNGIIGFTRNTNHSIRFYLQKNLNIELLQF